MLRFPNPGSDIQSFIRIFCAIAQDLGSSPAFSLDDISNVLVRRNLASSSGYMGDEALSRSYNQDRSRDRLYNQSKMYAELFRSLGWFQTTAAGRLSYTLSFLGRHVASTQDDVGEIFRQSILGIAYPSPVIEIRSESEVRPFAAILRTMAKMDGLLCRDEMIVGPMCVTSDRDKTAFSAMINRLTRTRGSSKALQAWIREVSAAREITETTMGNYTRFPLAVLEWSGWTTKERLKEPYGRSMVFHRLTTLGAEAAEQIELSWDVRTIDLEKAAAEETAAISRLGFYQMLERARFDVRPVSDQLAKDTQTLRGGRFGKSLDRTILFSPFQQLPHSVANQAFTLEPEVAPIKSGRAAQDDKRLVQRHDKSQPLGVVKLLDTRFGANAVRDGRQSDREVRDITQLIIDTHRRCGRRFDDTIEAIFELYSAANKTEFYPLVAAMFRLLGLPCEATRHGINYQRWDAIIASDSKSIPIEIKSPGEEQFISVKGVRQALENKIVLLSRRSYVTDRDTTSLLVGYNAPNDRAEVNGLVADILSAFKMRVGVIDFRSLTRLAADCILHGKKLDLASLHNLTGLIDVQDS